MLIQYTICLIARTYFVAALLIAGTPGFYAAGSKPYAVPTFESLGLYYDCPLAQDSCRLHYRPAGATEWREGYPLVYDARERQYRGSLVQLKPDTLYEIRLDIGGDRVELQQRMLSEQFPIGKTTVLPGGTTDKTITISDGGTETGWRLVRPAAGARFISDVFNLSDYNVVVEADYFILRGLELKNSGVHGVLIRSGVQHVVVEDCHITGWGRIGGARVWGVTSGMDSGIYAERDAGHLVIQRNLIENPRGGANDWETGHPSGPQGVSLIDSRGGNIIRYNTIRSTEDHGFNDGIGGASNFSFKGSPNRSDIYGNIVSNCWDDCIESEGANMNISHQDHSGGTMIKTGMNYLQINGEKVSTGRGYRFIFHNTALQPGGALDVFTNHELHNAVSRNNIFYARGRTYPNDSRRAPERFPERPDGRLSRRRVRAVDVSGQRAAGVVSGADDEPHPVGQGGVQPEREGFFDHRSAGAGEESAIDTAIRLPGFSDEYRGAGPDIGAFENGLAPLRFGREMAPGFFRAPREQY